MKGFAAFEKDILRKPKPKTTQKFFLNIFERYYVAHEQIIFCMKNYFVFL